MNRLKDELYTLIKNDSFIFDFIQEYALDGLCFWDLERREKIWLNPKFWTTLGFSQESIDEQPSDFQAVINSEDYQLVNQTFDNQLSNSDFHFDQTLRFTHANGNTVWMRCYGMVIKNAAGNATKFLGALIDISLQKKAELDLNHQLDRYFHIIEGSNLGTWEWNIQTGECIFNERWAELIGYTLEELGSTTIETWSALANPDDLIISNELLEQHFSGKNEYYECEVRMKHKNGDWVWILDRGRVISWTKDGEPEWMMGSHQDITDKKSLNEDLLDQYLLNKQFVEQAPTAIALFDNEMKYLSASNQWKLDYGIDEKEFIGKSHYEVFPEISDHWKEIHQRCLKGEIMKEEEDLFLRADGHKQWIQWEVRPWYKSENKIGGLLMFTADITATKVREDLLIEYQDLLKRTKSIAKIGTWDFNLVTQEITWSEVTKHIHEVPLDFIPKYDEAIEFYPKGINREKINVALQDSIQNGNNYDLELQIKTAKNRLKWVRAIGIPVFENGKCVKVHGLFQDIDEKNTTLKNLAFEKEQFRKTFDYAPIGMAIVGLDGRWLKINNIICEILGYTKEELYSKTFQDITYPEDLELDLEHLNQLVKGEIENYAIEKRYYHKNGHVIWALLAVSMVKNEKQSPVHFVSQIQDITELKIQQQQLENTIDRLQGIQDASTQVAIIETDLKGVVKSFNRGAENLIGFKSSEVINKIPLRNFISESDLENHQLRLFEQGFLQVNQENELFLLAKSGSYETNDWTFKRKDGSTFKAQLTVTPIKNNQHKITGYLGVVSNIDKLKSAEKEIKSLLKVTQDQNKRLLNFAHIVSHNLRSHTGNFKMLLDLMKLQIPEATENQLYPLLIKSADNLINTVSHLNEVVVMNTTVEENLDQVCLLPFLEGAVASVNAKIIELDAEINIEVDQNQEVVGLPAYMESTFQNLISNALKYRHPERKPKINILSSVDGRNTRITFSDNGLGIDLKRHGAKLFGMYKTFHGNKDARGIGLFITKNQVEAMGGQISVESSLGEGTTFILTFRNEKN